MSKDFPDRETIRKLAKTKPAAALALTKLLLRRERQAEDARQGRAIQAEREQQRNGLPPNEPQSPPETPNASTGQQ